MICCMTLILYSHLTCLMAWKWSSLENFPYVAFKDRACCGVQWTSYTSVVDPFGLQCSISWWVFCLFFSTHRWEYEIVKLQPLLLLNSLFLPSILSVFAECVLATLLSWAHMFIVTLASSWMDSFYYKKSLSLSNMFCFNALLSLIFSSLHCLHSYFFFPTYIFEFKYVSCRWHSWILLLNWVLY